MENFKKRFQEMLFEKHSATKGHAILSEKEVLLLCAICNGFLPTANINVNPFDECKRVGLINYLIQNMSKSELIDHFRSYVESEANDNICNLDFSNAEELVSKLQSMSAADYSDLVRRIALFWATPEDIEKYIA